MQWVQTAKPRNNENESLLYPSIRNTGKLSYKSGKIVNLSKVRLN